MRLLLPLLVVLKDLLCLFVEFLSPLCSSLDTLLFFVDAFSRVELFGLDSEGYFLTNDFILFLLEVVGLFLFLEEGRQSAVLLFVMLECLLGVTGGPRA